MSIHITYTRSVQFVLLMSLSFWAVDAIAGHRAGGQFTWECIAPNTYVIKFNRIIDCAHNLDDETKYCLTGSLAGDPNNGTFTVDSAFSIPHPVAFCPSTPTCGGGASLNWVTEVVYLDTIVLTPFSPTYFITYCDGGGRPNADNANGGFYVEAFFDTLVPCNTSAQPGIYHDIFYCAGDSAVITNNITDPDGDSLVFRLDACLNGPGNPLNYNAGFSGLNPMTSTTGWQIDSLGNMYFLPPSPQKGHVCLVIEEWRNGVKIAENTMDMLIHVIQCEGSIPATEPSVSPTTVINDGCVGTLVAFGYKESSITWTSVNPMPVGTYDSYLSCLSGCDTTMVLAQPGFPPFIDFEVCGKPLEGCDTSVVSCDTVRVFFNSTLLVAIAPATPTVCFGSTGTTITANGSGGTPPYTYNWSTGDTTQSSFVGVGTYSVTISDATDCPPVADTITVTSFASTITANAGLDTSICVENLPVPLSGSITAASGGVWVGNGSFSPNDSNLAVTYTPTPGELTAGTSDLILITTGNGSCPADTDTVSITYLSFDGTLNLTTTNITCNGAANGVANASVTGGTGPFTFTWNSSPVQVGDSAMGLDTGSYTVIASNGNGCITTSPFIVTEPPPLAVSITGQTNVDCNGNSSGYAIALGNGGTAPYNYIWSSGSSLDTANSLTAGTYTVSVSDANGCGPFMDTVLITEPLQLSVSVTGQTNVDCNGNSTGSATAAGSGGTTPYAYAWSSGAAIDTANTLQAGIYTVSITDVNGCGPVIDTVLITQPLPLSVSINGQTNVDCNGNSTGAASAVGSGGTAPYAYVWSSGAVINGANALAAGTYTVSITDTNGCGPVTNTVIITEPLALSVSINGQTNVDCNGNNTGLAFAAGSGGTVPYTYAWSSGAILDTAFNLTVGTYVVGITDTNGCGPVMDTVLITEPPPLSVSIIGQTNVDCNGNNSGSAFALGSGGTAPYNYIWSSGASLDTANSLTAGTYTVSVSDANGCGPVTDMVVISQPLTLAVSITGQTNVDCNGNNTGSANAAGSGGTSPYAYTWSSGAFIDTANSLAAGTYTVSVSDANGCGPITDTVVVTEPLPLSVSISGQTNVDCNGNSTGAAGAFGSGGTAPYFYSWSSGAVIDSATVLAAGTYTVSVEDANGCGPVTTNITVSEPPVLTASLLVTDVSCFGGNDGTITASAVGGTPTYSYNWSSGQITSTAASLTQGTYNVTITDVNNCSVTILDTVTEPLLLNATALGVDVSCFNGSNGTAFVNASGGTGGYAYQWSGGQLIPNITGLASGAYVVTVTDGNNCTDSAGVSIAQPGPLQVNALSDDTICPGDSALITAVASGGNGGYGYSWDQGIGPGQNHFVLPSVSTTYSVIANDILGCLSLPDTVRVEVRVENFDALSLISSGDICIGESAEISANYNSTNGFSFVWSNGLGSDLGPHVVTPSGTEIYHLTVTDVCGNMISDSIEVEVYPLPDIDLPEIIAEGCSPLQVNFENMDAVNAGDQYLWDFGDGTFSTEVEPTHTYVQSGLYAVSLFVTSSNGCVNSGGINHWVKVLPSPVADFTANPNKTDIRNPFIQFTDRSTSATAHFWDLGDGNTSMQVSPSYVYQDTGTYEVTLIVTNDTGCSHQLTSEVRIDPYFTIEVPNAFTPNSLFSSGGLYDMNALDNDVFHPHTVGVRNYQLLVFNRWGEQIFESFELERGWDGYFKGKLSQQGVYVWRLDIKWSNGQEFSKAGDVTLLR